MESSKEDKAEWTYIRVKPETAERLKQAGKKGETYDDILQRIIKKAFRGRI